MSALYIYACICTLHLVWTICPICLHIFQFNKGQIAETLRMRLSRSPLDCTTMIQAPTNKLCHTSAPFPILNRPFSKEAFWWPTRTGLQMVETVVNIDAFDNSRWESLNSKNSGKFSLLQPVEGGMFGTIRMMSFTNLGRFFPLKIREKWWDNMGAAGKKRDPPGHTGAAAAAEGVTMIPGWRTCHESKGWFWMVAF